MNNNSWKAFFTYTKNERKGIYALTVIILLIAIYNAFGDFKTIIKTDFSGFETEIAKYKIALHKKALEKPKKKNSYSSKEQITELKLKYFDPNTASKKDWLDIGLKEKQVISILKYLTKGGSFTKPEDINKIYCLSDSEKKSILPYIAINNDKVYDDLTEVYFGDDLEIEESNVFLDLNIVTIEELLEVRGIGPATAKSIIKYRDLLGGFYNIEQLREVFLIDSSKYLQIESLLYVSKESLSQSLDLNESNYYNLLKHPYINKSIAYNIEDYRKTHGNFNKIEQIKNVPGINDSIYERIYRYFAPLK